MPIPKLSFVGEVATVTMMELRSNPGEILDRVSRGLEVRVTKQGRWVATMKAPALAVSADDTIVVRPDGTTEDDRKPLTFRLDLGGEYAERTRREKVRAFHPLGRSDATERSAYRTRS